MIPCEAIQNTIATSQGIELLRGVVVTLLNDIEAKRTRLAKLDPIADPAVAQATSDAVRSQLGATHNIDVMRSMADDLFRGVEKLDVQIARAEKK